jgi:hypothetical protein
MVVSKIFQIDTVKIMKLTIRPISHHHPHSSSLLHIDTSPSISYIFGMLPGSPFQSVSSAHCDSAWISLVVSNWHPFCFNFIVGNRKKSQSAKSGEYSGWGWQPLVFCWQLLDEDKCETGCCHGEAARSFLTKLQGDVFARFLTAATKYLCRNLEFTCWPVGSSASRYHCRIDGGTSPEYFGYHLIMT